MLHSKTTSADINKTVAASQRYLLQMMNLRSSLNVIEQTLMALDQVNSAGDSFVEAERSSDYHKHLRTLQNKIWIDNILRQLTNLRSQINEFTEQVKVTETLVS